MAARGRNTHDGEETVRLLAATEVFSDLDPRELEAVAQVAVPRSWDRGQVIFRGLGLGLYIAVTSCKRSRQGS